jgi:hypothetical protein
MRTQPLNPMSSIQKTRFNDITFDRLLGIRGVSGAMLTEAGKRTLSRTKLAETEAGRLSYLARHLCRGYRKVRRIPNRILIAYEKSALLIVSKDDTQLVLILESKLDIDTVSAAASAYMNKLMNRPLRLPREKKASA